MGKFAMTISGLLLLLAPGGGEAGPGTTFAPPRHYIRPAPGTTLATPPPLLDLDVLMSGSRGAEHSGDSAS